MPSASLRPAACCALWCELPGPAQALTVAASLLDWTVAPAARQPRMVSRWHPVRAAAVIKG
jgi:hypothetical protein